MIADSLIVPECIYRPGSFTGLMTLYESNYIKLSQLVSGLHALPERGARRAVSRSDTDCDLHFELTLLETYTTTLKLTYLFDSRRGDGQSRKLVADPDLTVRVYHDARLVEAIRGRERHRHHKLRELARTHSRELDRRWRNNMMLNKWLDYLLEMGHHFPSLPVSGSMP